MELRQIEYFVAACREKSFVSAAKKISISQQALSRSIQNLEDELGVKLFIRRPRSLELTAYGELLLESALSILSSVKYIKRRIEKEKLSEHSQLKFAFTDGFEDYRVLEGFTELHPEYQLSSFSMTDRQIEAALLDGAIDFAISSGMGAHPELNYRVLKNDSAYVVSDGKMPFSIWPNVPIHALKDLNIIFAPPEFNVGVRLEGLCKMAGFTPKIVNNTANLDYIAKLIANNRRVFICHEGLLDYFNAHGLKATKLETEYPVFSLCFITRKNSPPTRGAELFEKYYAGVCDET